MKMKTMPITVREMVFTALFTSVLCAVAPFSIEIGPIPLSFATLIIYIAAGSLGWKCATICVLLYVTLGAIGIPVFSRFEGGFHKIAGMTGGFIIGYIPCVLATGAIFEAFRKKLAAYVVGMVIGTVLLYTCGTVWFILQTGSTLATSLLLCVTPFLPGDTLKIVVASIVAPMLRNALANTTRV